MPEPRNAREELLQRGIDRLRSQSESTEDIVRDVLEWFTGGGKLPEPYTVDGFVTEYLIYRANRAMGEGVPRYAPVDGHDWHEGLTPATHEDIERWQESGELHRAVGLPVPNRRAEESPATTPRSDRAPGDRMEGPIAPTG